MLKRLCLALAGLFALATVAQGAGTVPGFSLTPQFDLTGHVAPGCKLYIIQAGTTSTPQNAYQDSGLSILQPNPMTCDAAGRLGMFFVADGVIKLRLTTSTGTQIFVGDNLVVVGASGGGGGGGTVDPTTILATGDIKVAYGTGILSGFVRANGRTIGSSTSGATERANSDTQALFQYLWGADANLAVSGGRGASAAADWAANKTIALPDARGRAIFADDAMGNSAAGRLTIGCSVFGSSCGSQSQNIARSQLPNVTLSYSNSISVNSTIGNIIQGSVPFPVFNYGSGGGSFLSGIASGAVAGAVTSTGTSSGGTSSINGGVTQDVFVTTPPAIVMTYYLKL
jgi:hypothetical protein